MDLVFSMEQFTFEKLLISFRVLYIGKFHTFECIKIVKENIYLNSINKFTDKNLKGTGKGNMKFFPYL